MIGFYATWLTIVFTGLTGLAFAQSITIKQGFAHNDYLHKRPLFDALENGYVNIEADIFLQNNKLVIAHWFPFFKEKRTLEDLYFVPLNHYLQLHSTDSIPFQFPITLFIDIKSSPKNTYIALRSLLNKYSNILTSYENGVIKQGKVNIVITGRKPVGLIKKEHKRFVMMDDMLNGSDTSAISNIYASSSCKYSHILSWTGMGRIPDKEKSKLQDLITIAHSQGKKARLWASPENDKVRTELIACGVDYIVTDKLIELKQYLLNFNECSLLLVKNN
jgi:hypothetical protein